jgi:hypothetical protein
MAKVPLISQILKALVKILTKIKFKCSSKCCESDCICNNKEGEKDNNVNEYIDENKKLTHITDL